MNTASVKLKDRIRRIRWAPAAYNGLRNVRLAIEIRVARAFARFHWTASLYYLVFSREFGREHQAVLRGRIEHLTNAGSTDAKRFLLRRNTHRLEKALIMRPLRKVFAKDYIDETVAAYEHVVAKDSSDPARHQELKWFSNVLAKYFDAIDLTNEPGLQKRKKRFETALPAGHRIDLSSVPYASAKRPDVGVSYQAFLALCKRRRSVRWFLPLPVERTTIDKAITAAIEAPSACNRQPYEFRVFTQGELLKAVARTPMGTRGFHENFPAIVVLVGKLDAYPYERDRHVIYIDASLAAMQFMLAAETLGLSTCPINWPDIDSREKEMAKLLQLEAYERPIMLIAVGHPDPHGGVPFSEKTNLELIRRFS